MGSDKKVTRNDVAKRAGVSPAVVSYVINQSKFVSEEKTLAVRKAIEELKYRPNMHARSLKTNQSMQIAYVCDNLRNDWLEISEKMLFDKGYIVSHLYSRDGEAFIQRLINGQFDGVFMMSNRYTSEMLNRISEEGIPVVIYKTREYAHTLNPAITAVVPDYYEGVRLLTNYLVMKGHKRIILIPPLRYNMELFRGGYRENAFRETMKQNDLPEENGIILQKIESMETMAEELCGLLFGRSAGERATAIIAGNDSMAGWIIQYVNRLGFRVPEDLAVTGMDNSYLADMIQPRLTTMDFSKEEFSRELTDTMLRLINGEEAQDHFIPVSLAIHESA